MWTNLTGRSIRCDTDVRGSKSTFGWSGITNLRPTVWKSMLSSRADPADYPVRKGGHKTQTSKTDREPDTAYHISVRFGKIADRAGPGQVWAYSVHIYLNDNTKKYEPREVIWGNPTPDRPEQSAVYKNRIQWPTGATATTAPPAPGEQPLVSTTSTEGLAPASLPTTNPWGGSIIPSRPPNPPQWGEGPGQGPAAGGGGST
ncbi:uncharacterized protein BDCG_09182 [Blastomyces dermatitidis ER-3]|uniref:Uncharacterized protein n=1 Tax=Ajellomyces dermatitidis (strain ER-3 / ATCC MYA-2586) TaxID=559297 RepID=A0ABM9YGB7_AJEDR|nr:uncharacterized protein BDCG_09182 [Blastomyces dermatitidis ER-3]EEQ85913.2 hypothetical protein BDCG_09182 [Blastomyces dermatitidis ER-3]